MMFYREDSLRPEQLYTLIGRNIKHLRKEHGMTQETLADFIESDQKQISKIEAGKARPSLSIYLRIANVFQVSIDRLLVGAIKLNQCGHEQIKHTSLILGADEQKLTQDLIQAIVEYLEKRE